MSVKSTSTENFAKDLFVQLRKIIISKESDAIKGQIEAIHAMRVAIRRLRVALVNFAACMTIEDRKRLDSDLKRLADKLGEVRNLDVMIATLDNSRKNSHSDDKRMIRYLTSRLKARRRRRLKQLKAYLHEQEYISFKNDPFFQPVEHVEKSGTAQSHSEVIYG